MIEACVCMICVCVHVCVSVWRDLCVHVRVHVQVHTCQNSCLNIIITGLPNSSIRCTHCTYQTSPFYQLEIGHALYICVA